MAREPLKNVGASVRARLLQRSRDERADFQILLTRYALERLLYRLSLSEHRDRFILKGAMLFVTWVEVPFRPTRDLDLLGFGESTPAAIGDAFRAILALAVDDDGVVFDTQRLEAAAIREGVEYGGVRVRTSATIGGARVLIQVDVGFGDVITPGPVEIDYPVLLDAPVPHLRAYPMETVVAEKLHALVTLGIANSRLKDYYDLWLTADTFELERSLLARAVRQTFERRETALPDGELAGLSPAYVESWGGQWTAFLTRERMAAAPGELEEVVADLARFLLPLIEDDGDGGWSWSWKPREGWVQGAPRERR